MKTNRVMCSIASACALALGACSSNPDAGSPAYKKGTLGNGDFLFSCEDGAACLPYSNDAEKFPEAVATGANFAIRFVASGEQGTSITWGNKRYDGITVRALGPYLGDGPSGFAALAPGYGTSSCRTTLGSSSTTSR